MVFNATFNQWPGVAGQSIVFSVVSVEMFQHLIKRCTGETEVNYFNKCITLKSTLSVNTTLVPCVFVVRYLLPNTSESLSSGAQNLQPSTLLQSFWRCEESLRRCTHYALQMLVSTTFFVHYTTNRSLYRFPCISQYIMSVMWYKFL